MTDEEKAFEHALAAVVEHARARRVSARRAFVELIAAGLISTGVLALSRGSASGKQHRDRGSRSHSDARDKKGTKK